MNYTFKENATSDVSRAPASLPTLAKHPTRFGLPFASPDGEAGSWLIALGLDRRCGEDTSFLLEVADFRGRRLSEIWRMILDAQGRPYEDWPLGAGDSRMSATDLTPSFQGLRAGASGQLILLVSIWLETFCPDLRSPLSSIWATGVLEVDSGLRSVNGAAAKALHVLDYANSCGGVHMLIAPEANHFEVAHAFAEHQGAVLLLTFSGREAFLRALYSALAQKNEGGALLVVCFLFSPLDDLANLLEALKLLAHGLVTQRATHRSNPLTRPKLLHLRVLTPPPQNPSTLPLHSGRRICVGASPQNELQLEEHGLEALHCSIYSGDGAPLLTNHARSDAFVSGQRLCTEESAPMTSGELIRVGDALLTLEELVEGADAYPSAGADPVTGLTMLSEWRGGITLEQWLSIKLELSSGSEHLTQIQLEARYFAPWRRWVLAQLRARHPGCVLLVQDPSRMLVLLEPSRGWARERIIGTLAEGEPSWLTNTPPDMWTHISSIEKKPTCAVDETIEDRIAKLESWLSRAQGGE